MKKILFASTALVLSAGVAAADVTLSGSARFGLMYNSKPDIGDANWAAGAHTSDTKTRLEKRVDINIDGSTTADNGVTFGARIRIRSEEITQAGTLTWGGGRSMAAAARVYAQSGGFTVAVGNIIGALEVMPGVYGASTGLTGLSWGGMIVHADRAGSGLANSNFDFHSYSSNGPGAEGIEVLYSAGDFAFHISHSSEDLSGEAGKSTWTAAYAAYNFQGWTVALGVQDAGADGDTADKIVLTAGGNIGDFGVGVGLARLGSGAGKVNKVALNGSYSFGATSVNGYVAYQDEDFGGGVTGVQSKTSFGIGAAYNLGGGARLVGGIERTTQKATRADLGVAFNF